jgi:2-amino-4-hydroxy-6-hydroxymethyldihydropteridine diphosphokinase
MTVRAFLALGSNMGERETYLAQAVQALHGKDGITVTGLSSVYETDPVGFVDQDAFLNMVVRVETELEPLQLLSTVMEIEQDLGRVRTIRWGPRTIDIDILLYGDERVELSDLTIPHPAMAERAFVLIPLSDVWEGGALPFFHKNIEECLASRGDEKGVRKWGKIDWAIESDPSGN